jgi:hypothetical protein
MEQIKVFTRAAALLAAMAAGGFWSAGAEAAGGYDPMARPVNPMAPGTSSKPDVQLNPELGNLPDTAGAEETFYLCTACHSAAIIRQQRLSDARWDYLWNWMVEKQGMPEQDPETRETVLSYLKRHFSSQR